MAVALQIVVDQYSRRLVTYNASVFGEHFAGGLGVVN